MRILYSIQSADDEVDFENCVEAPHDDNDDGDDENDGDGMVIEYSNDKPLTASVVCSALGGWVESWQT